jgi:hypothetical protein
MAVEHGPDDLVVAQHHLFVHAALGIVQRDLVIVLVGRSERAGREHVDAGDLQAGEDRRRHIDRGGVAGKPSAAHRGLLPDRRHQAEDLAVMLDAFADRVDVGIAGAHVVADQDAAIDVELGNAGQIDIGPDADRQHDEIGRDLASVGEDDAFGPAGPEDLFGLAVRKKRDAPGVEIAAQPLAGRRVELPLHQGRH